MFLLTALILVIAALVHAARAGRGLEGRLELVLVYLLAGYHGVVMLVVSGYLFLAPERGAAMVSAEPGNPFQLFFGFAYLGMSVTAILTIWWRGRYVDGQVILWSIYFFGATWIHLRTFAEEGNLTPWWFFRIVVSHALMPVVMIALALWRARLQAGSDRALAHAQTFADSLGPGSGTPRRS